MVNYLGEFPVDLKDTRFADFTPADWAMLYIRRYGQIDGAHHKTWVLDQVARILSGTPVIVTVRKWEPSAKYPEGLTEFDFNTGEPSPEYLAWVERMLGGTDEDGEREYGYDEGIAP